MKRLNADAIRSNLDEARDELERLCRALGAGANEEELQLGLEHALHHICFAWNARHASRARLVKLSDADSKAWSRFPQELKPFAVDVNPPRRRRR